MKKFPRSINLKEELSEDVIKIAYSDKLIVRRIPHGQQSILATIISTLIQCRLKSSEMGKIVITVKNESRRRSLNHVRTNAVR
jgi:hypothetical protein